MKPRNVYIYKKTPALMTEIKAGDIFSMDPRDDSDNLVNPESLMIAVSNGAILQDGPFAGACEVLARGLKEYNLDYGIDHNGKPI